METKRCFKCHQVKSINDFYNNKRSLDGKYSIDIKCEVCNNIVAEGDLKRRETYRRPSSQPPSAVVSFRNLGGGLFQGRHVGRN
jgi:hypothetical protein